MYISVFRMILRSMRMHPYRACIFLKIYTCNIRRNPSPGGVAQLVERVLYHSTRRAVPERSWVQSLLPTTEVEPGFSTFGGMLVPVLQLISPVCKTGTSLYVTYVEKYAKIRIRDGKSTPKWHRMSNIRRQFESKPLFIYAGKKAYAEGLLNYTAYSVCMYIHTPTAYDRTTQPYGGARAQAPG
jgi:hypothetical protein